MKEWNNAKDHFDGGDAHTFIIVIFTRSHYERKNRKGKPNRNDCEKPTHQLDVDDVLINTIRNFFGSISFRYSTSIWRWSTDFSNLIEWMDGQLREENDHEPSQI
jgi:hypothetical protein